MTCADIDYFSRPPKDEADIMNDPEQKTYAESSLAPRSPKKINSN